MNDPQNRRPHLAAQLCGLFQQALFLLVYAHWDTSQEVQHSNLGPSESETAQWLCPVWECVCVFLHIIEEHTHSKEAWLQLNLCPLT